MPWGKSSTIIRIARTTRWPTRSVRDFTTSGTVTGTDRPLPLLTIGGFNCVAQTSEVMGYGHEDRDLRLWTTPCQVCR